jgi:hypothetical protein
MVRADHRLAIAVGVAVLVTGLGVVGTVGAGGTSKVKTKMAKLEIGPDGASGQVKAKNSACVKKRTVKLKGPEPFDPNARRRGLEAGAVLIGKDKTDRKGRWAIDPPKGGAFTAGDYLVIVTSVRLSFVDNHLLCKAFRETLPA